jgi:hypothetical protein
MITFRLEPVQCASDLGSMLGSLRNYTKARVPVLAAFALWSLDPWMRRELSQASTRNGSRHEARQTQASPPFTYLEAAIDPAFLYGFNNTKYGL